MKKHIVAISGGGFSNVECAFIDQYLLSIKRIERPLHIAFVPTASKDASRYIDKFYNAFPNEITSHLLIEDLYQANIQNVVNELDIIYIGGGNTSYMLNVWKNAGFDQVLRNAYHNGVIMAGISAGAMCFFEACYIENHKNIYELHQGLGILKGSLCPHYDHLDRKNIYEDWSKHNQKLKHYKLTDCENLHFCNEKLIAKIVT